MNSGQHTQTAPDLEGLRAGLHSMWETVAPQWTRNAAYIEQRSADLTASMLDAVAISNGERVLELACGPGALGLAVAKRFPDSEVILSDIAAGMAAAAAVEAEERGLANVRVAELDLERIDQQENSFDVVLCREGIMLVPEPGRAAGEIRRVLGPGGRTAVSVWGSAEQNPWLTALMRALSVQLDGTFPPPGMPGPLALGSPEKLARRWRTVVSRRPRSGRSRSPGVAHPSTSGGIAPPHSPGRSRSCWRCSRRRSSTRFGRPRESCSPGTRPRTGWRSPGRPWWGRRSRLRRDGRQPRRVRDEGVAGLAACLGYG